MVLDAIGRHSRAEWTGDPRAMRRESVLGLCRRCGWNEAHATKVEPPGRRAVRRHRGPARLDVEDRELLELGALLHDIGEHVSMEGHERHTAYLIENGRLRGFRPDEVAVLACLGRFHKRGTPEVVVRALRPARAATGRDRVTRLVALLQVADALDRSHGGPVRDIEVYTSPGLVEVVVTPTTTSTSSCGACAASGSCSSGSSTCRLEVVERHCRCRSTGDDPLPGRQRAAPGPSDLSAAGSVARHLRPGQVLVGAHVAGQAEHPLAEDVAHDLGGAALDRVGPGPQEHPLRTEPRSRRRRPAGASRSCRRACPSAPSRSTHSS